MQYIFPFGFLTMALRFALQASPSSALRSCSAPPSHDTGGLLLILLATLGMPLFVVLGGLTWLLLRSAELDTSAIIIEMYRLAIRPPC